MATGGVTLLGTAGNATTATVGATAIGDGAVTITPFPIEAISVQAEIQGNPTACVINLYGLLDGNTYDLLATLDITAGYISGALVPLQKPMLVRKLKGNISALSGGTNPSVALYAAWRD